MFGYHSKSLQKTAQKKDIAVHFAYLIRDKGEIFLIIS